MAKQLKSILNGVKSSKIDAGSTGDNPAVDYADKSKDIRDIVAKHKTEKHNDRVGNENSYKSNKSQADMKGHGNKSGQDEKQYEEANGDHDEKCTCEDCKHRKLLIDKNKIIDEA
jgi:hypothetical protein